MAAQDLPALRWSPKQRHSFCDSTARINIWHGSVRSGKTVISMWRWIDFLLNGPPGLVCMVGKTLRTLKTNILLQMEEILGSRRFKFSTNNGEATLGNRLIYLVGANDERSEQKIRGVTLAGTYGDEISLWPESFFKMSLSRLSVHGAKFFGTTNPDNPLHYLKKDYLDRKDSLNLKSWHFTLDDNPFLSAEYVDSIKEEYTGFWYRRFILGLWCVAEGLIYDMWDERLNTVCAVAAQAFPHYIVGVDYGTSNPCTFGVYGYTDRSEVVLLDEYRWDSVKEQRQKTDAQYADDMEIFFRKNLFSKSRRSVPIYVDPSAASFIAELRSRGFCVIPGENDVLGGIRFMSAMIARREYKISSACRATRDEFMTYSWDPRAANRGEDKPLKTGDHAMDRDRYALYTHFGVAKYFDESMVQ